MQRGYESDEELSETTLSPNYCCQLWPEVTEVLPNEPTMTLRIIKSSIPLHQLAYPILYTVTPRGVLGSLRKIDIDGNIKIGRQVINEDGIRVNDIPMHPEDAQCSRQHSQILFGPGFANRFPLTDQQIAFLLGRHWRAGRWSWVQLLPNVLVEYIFSWLRPKPSFRIRDLGTIYGTYVRISGYNLCSWQDVYLYSATEGLAITGFNCTTSSIYVTYIVGDPCGIMVESGTLEVSGTRVIVNNQVKFKFRGSQWYISPNRNNSYGIWHSCSPYKRDFMRHTPREYELNRGDQIKISKTILQIDW